MPKKNRIFSLIGALMGQWCGGLAANEDERRRNLRPSLEMRRSTTTTTLESPELFQDLYEDGGVVDDYTRRLLLSRKASFRGAPVRFAEAYKLALADGWTLHTISENNQRKLRGATALLMPPRRRRGTHDWPTPPSVPTVCEIFGEITPEGTHIVVPKTFYRFYLCAVPLSQCPSPGKNKIAL